MADQYNVTLFSHWKTASFTRKSYTWETLKAEFTNGHTHTTASDKRNTPAISPAEFKEGAHSKSQENVLAVSLLVLDFDDATTEQTVAIQQHLLNQGLRAIIYSSYSNNPSPPPLLPLFRFRVIVPLEQPVPAAKWAAFWARETAKFPHANLDERCKNPAWIYGLNHTPNIQAAFHRVFEGRELGVDLTGLDTPSLPRPRVPGQTTTPSAEPGSSLITTYAVSSKDLVPFIKQLKRTNPESEMAVANLNMADWLTKIKDGHEYAAPHTRHDTKLRITAKLERRFPNATLDDLTALFFASHCLMYKDQGDAAIRDAQQDTFYAFQGARKRRLESVEAKKSTTEQEQYGRAILINPQGPYTDEDFEEFAHRHSVGLDQFRKHWIVQQNKSLYFWTRSGYVGPLGFAEWEPAVARYLAPLEISTYGYSQWKMTEGGRAHKTVPELLREFGSLASEVCYSHHEDSTYNPKSGKLIIRHAVKAYDTAEFDPVIHEWLQALAGDQFEMVCRWIVLARDLSYPVPAIYIHNAPGVGKDVFARCMASLWWRDDYTKEPTNFVNGEAATAKHGDLLGHPVVFANEALPTAWQGPLGFARLREAVTGRSFGIEQKFHSICQLRSHIRIILAANNDNLLHGITDLTAHDREAIAQRLFDVPVPNGAAGKILEAALAEDRQLIERWVHGRFLRHVEWLAEQNTMSTRVGRFGLQLEHSELVEKIAHNQYSVSAIGEWLVRLILDPKKWLALIGSEADEYVRITPEGEIAINHGAFRDQELWGCYTSDKFPSIRVRQTGLAQYRSREWVAGKRFNVLDLAQLARFAESKDLASAEVLTQAAAACTVRLANLQAAPKKAASVVKI